MSDNSKKSKSTTPATPAADGLPSTAKLPDAPPVDVSGAAAASEADEAAIMAQLEEEERKRQEVPATPPVSAPTPEQVEEARIDALCEAAYRAEMERGEAEADAAMQRAKARAEEAVRRVLEGGSVTVAGRVLGDIPVVVQKPDLAANMGGRRYNAKAGDEIEMDPCHAAELESIGRVKRVTVVA
jgi:uncharacterized membrane protein YqiK